MRITIENLTKEIQKTEVLKQINMNLEGGKIYGLRGINGSGKTMLLRVISGLIFPTSGRVTFDEKILHQDIEYLESTGLLLEQPSFIGGYTGLKNLRLLAELQGKVNIGEIEEILEKVGLNPKDKRTYRKYSLGMKQRLGIACAFMGSPQVILLDEPTNALDDEGILLLRTLVLQAKKRGALVIIASHDREELEKVAGHIFIVKNGMLVE